VNFTRNLAILAAHLGHDNAAAVTRKDLIGFKEARLRAGKAPKTVVTELGGIAAVFSWASRNEKLTMNPATKIVSAGAKIPHRSGRIVR
jgi:site-specific recombinase XerC